MSSRSLRVGLCYSLDSLQRPSVKRRLESLDLLILPELVEGGYAALESGALKERGTQTVHSLRDFKGVGSLYCVAGSFPVRAAGGGWTNTSFVFKKGRRIARYDKVHLFKPAKDHVYFKRGNSLATFRLRWDRQAITAGLLICYDIRFPEQARALRFMGAEMLFVPARWPSKRDDAWRSLLKARAIENQAFVVGCNAKGGEGGFSYAFDPMGVEIFSNRRKRDNAIDVVELRLNALRNAKSLHDTVCESRLPVSADIASF